MPSEVPNPIRFDEDTVHASYEPAYANLFWRILVQCERVFSSARCQFVGKCSPVHFFWGSFDLAVTRFSGRRAPPREGPAFMREAYSHEVISHGFWPGSGPVPEPAFYAYAVPAPKGFESIAVEPPAAFYHRDLGEYILRLHRFDLRAGGDARRMGSRGARARAVSFILGRTLTPCGSTHSSNLALLSDVRQFPGGRAMPHEFLAVRSRTPCVNPLGR